MDKNTSEKTTKKNIIQFSYIRESNFWINKKNHKHVVLWCWFVEMIFGVLNKLKMKFNRDEMKLCKLLLKSWSWNVFYIFEIDMKFEIIHRVEDK